MPPTILFHLNQHMFKSNSDLQSYYQCVTGELISFYLSRLLGLDNVPLVALAQVNSSSPQWHAVKPQMQRANWSEGVIIALIQWIDGIDHVRWVCASIHILNSCLLTAFNNTRFVINVNTINRNNRNEGNQVNLL